MDPMPPEALLADVPEPMADIARRLRLVVRNALPDAVERVRTGWRIIGYDVPLGRRSVYFAWIWPQVEHVHLGFVHGVAMDDPERRLHGQRGVKLARWVTLTPGDPIDEPALGTLVREGARVALLPRVERLWHAIDREAGPAIGSAFGRNGPSGCRSEMLASTARSLDRMPAQRTVPGRRQRLFR